LNSFCRCDRERGQRRGSSARPSALSHPKLMDRAKTKKVRVWSLHNRTCNMMRNPIILEVPVESTRARTTCFRPYHI
jgi:hypothetical protein